MESQGLIECVPNVSEGRDPQTIEALAEVIRSVPGISRVHVDSDPDANRTVFTFWGAPAPVEQAAYRLIETAVQRIDMRTHRGVHVRNGAVDVCPFIPLGTTPMDQCVQLARRLAQAVGDTLRIPCYLYGEAALADERRSLSHLRKGQYEALARKLADGRFTPDAGPSTWSERTARSGSVQIGARPILIALNANLDTPDVKVARDLAARVRTSGRPRTGHRGIFEALLADGWFMARYGHAQITMNFTDYRRTPVHTVMDTLRAMAGERGVRITGAELIGLIPRDALLAAGRHYAPREEQSDDHLITLAADRLGLHDTRPFVPAQRILDPFG